MSYPIVSDNPTIQARYEYARKCGSKHVWAEMFAFRKAPGSKTDRELFTDVGTLADQFKGDERTLEKLVAKATRLGRRPQYTDYYCPDIVRPGVGPGDPMAFVPASEGRGHIKRVCERNKMDCTGAVNVTTGPLNLPKVGKKKEPSK